MDFDRDRYVNFVMGLGREVPPPYRDTHAQLIENMGFISNKIPHVRNGGLDILDVGPGTGSMMLLMSAMGNRVMGIDAASGHDCAAYAKIASEFSLDIKYIGFESLSQSVPEDWPRFDFILFRRSMDGIIKASRDCFEILRSIRKILADGAMAYINHNGGGESENFVDAVTAFPFLSSPLNTVKECILVKP